MASLKISVASADLRCGLKEAIPQIASTGATGIAFDLRNELTESAFGESAIKQVLHRMGEHGLIPATACFPLRLPLCEATHADERIAAITSAMLLARKLRVAAMAISVGPLPMPDSADDQQLHETLTAIAAAGNRTGTVPCFDFGTQPVERVKELVNRIDAGPVAIDINPVDWIPDPASQSAASKLRLSDITFGDGSNADDAPTLENYIRAVPEHVGHIQGRDARWSGRGSPAETTIGDGLVDWPMLLALLEEAGYNGWVTVRRESAGNPFEEIAKSVAYLR